MTDNTAPPTSSWSAIAQHRDLGVRLFEMVESDDPHKAIGPIAWALALALETIGRQAEHDQRPRSKLVETAAEEFDLMVRQILAVTDTIPLPDLMMQSRKNSQTEIAASFKSLKGQRLPPR